MIAGLLLAAGGSRRMRRPKLALELGGKSLLERSVSTLLATPLAALVVVVRPGGGAALASFTDPRLAVAVNRRPEEGMASSIRTGLSAIPAGAAAVLIALADKPLVRAETVRELILRFEAEGGPAVYPTHRGRPGHPVLFARSLFGELEEVAGDTGAREVLLRHRARARVVPVDDPGVLLDIDTPEDYANAVSRWEYTS